MATITSRIEVRLSHADKDRICRAATLNGVPPGTFVREAALQQADSILSRHPQLRRGSLSTILRGRATTSLSTDEIMKLMRGT